MADVPIGRSLSVINKFSCVSPLKRSSPSPPKCQNCLVYSTSAPNRAKHIKTEYAIKRAVNLTHGSREHFTKLPSASLQTRESINKRICGLSLTPIILHTSQAQINISKIQFVPSSYIESAYATHLVTRLLPPCMI